MLQTIIFLCQALSPLLYVDMSLMLDSNVADVLDSKTVSSESVAEVRVRAVHCIPGTTTSKTVRGRSRALKGEALFYCYWLATP